MSDNKPIIIIGIVTLLTFFGVIFLANKTVTKEQSVDAVDMSILITPETHIRGEASASATLVEFSDFQCPACGAFYPLVKSLEEKYTGKLRVAYKHYPLPQHQYAGKAAEAAEAAGAQGKFWEYHDLLFENQENLTIEDLKKYAQQASLNTDQFNTELDSGKYAQVVAGDIELGRKLSVNSTPAFYLNGKKLFLKTGSDLEIEIQKVLNTK